MKSKQRVRGFAAVVAACLVTLGVSAGCRAECRRRGLEHAHREGR